MAVIEGKARQTTSTTGVGEGAEVYARLLRDGTMSMASFKQVCVMQGLGFHVTSGAFSTGNIGDTSIVADEPQHVLSIPSKTSIMPIRIHIQVQGGAPADAEEVECLIGVDQDAVAVAATNSTEKLIYNMNTLFANTSSCKSYDDFTDSGLTAPVLDIELARAVQEFDVIGTQGVANSTGVDLLYEPKISPIINGPAMIVLYWGGDAAGAGGFAQIEWLEFASTVFAS